MSFVELDAVLELVKPGVSGDRLFLLILYAVLVDDMRELQKQVSIIVLVFLVPVCVAVSRQSSATQYQLHAT